MGRGEIETPSPLSCESHMKITTQYFEDIIIQQYFDSSLTTIRKVNFTISIPIESGLKERNIKVKMKGTAEDVISFIWRNIDPNHTLGKKTIGKERRLDKKFFGTEYGKELAYDCNFFTITSKEITEEPIKKEKPPRDRKGKLLPYRIGNKKFIGGFWRDKRGHFVRLPVRAR
jgi:hypothetical protein